MRALVDHHLHLDSPLHRWHPASKWVAFAAVALAVTGVRTLGVAGVVVLLSAALVPIARLPWRLVAWRVVPPAAFLAVLVVLTAFTAGASRAEGGRWGWSSDGLHLGALVATKCLAVVVLATVLLATTPTVRLFKALGDLGVPARVVGLVLLAYRLVFAMTEEVEALRRGAVCRGYRLGVSGRDLRTFGRLGGALLVRGLDRSHRLYAAMLARGYDGRVRALGMPRLTGADHAKLAAAVMLAGLLLATRWW